MAITGQKSTSEQSVKLSSGSLYQATQVTNEISLEAQVDEDGKTLEKIYFCVLRAFIKIPLRLVL